MSKSKDRPLLEAVLTNIEAAIDTVMTNDVIAAIPVVGTAFKICKGIDDLRSRALAAKLGAFFSSPEVGTPSVKAAIIKRTHVSPDETRRIGETLFLVLDRYIDLDKPEILAKVFVAYVDGVITATELQRLAQAIDTAFPADLHSLLAAEQHTVYGQLDGARHPWMETLIPTGLTVSTARGAGFVRPLTEVTLLGQVFWKAGRHVHHEA